MPRWKATRVRPRPAHIPDVPVFVRQANRVASTESRQFFSKLSEDFADRFKQQILDQSFPSFAANPLTADYLARKQSAGADSRVMVATKTYVNAIRVFQSTTRDGLRRFRIGFHPRDVAYDLHRRPTAFTLNRLAKVHEFGSLSGAIPPRPHWRPFAATIRKEMPQHVKRCGEHVVKQVVKQCTPLL